MRQHHKIARRQARAHGGSSMAVVAAFMAAMATMAAVPAAAADECGSFNEAGDYIICGTVWYDVDNDGVRDATESGLPNVTVTDSSHSFQATTDASGFYTIAIPPGTPGTTYAIGVDSGSSGLPEDANVTPPQEVSSSTTGFIDFIVTTGTEEAGPCDFITSGGFVVRNGKKVSFGAHGGCKNGEFWGQINLVDHATGYHVNSVEITGYVAPFGAANPTRDICGYATTNSTADTQWVRFRVRLMDNGEPGRDDLFGILLADEGADEKIAVSIDTPLNLADVKPGGGNVQLHDPNPSTTAPAHKANCLGLAFK